jgi:hypothetical protein
LTESGDDETVVDEVRQDAIVIEGLKLTMTGQQLIAKLDDRIEWHNDHIIDYRKHLKTAVPTDECPLPESVLEGEIDRSSNQVRILNLIRNHIVPDEIYRLGEFDLRFADLLPEEEWYDCGCFSRATRSREFGVHAFAGDPELPLTTE